MATGVQTVQGVVDPSELGIVHLHEHLLSNFSCYLPADAETWDRSEIELGSYTRHLRHAATYHNLTLGDLDEAETELRAFQALGGSTVVDSTSIGIGRDPGGLHELSTRTGAHIVMGCGWYIDASLPDGFAERTIESLTAEIVDDLTLGVGESGIKAGIIGEVGLSWPHRDNELLSLHAASLAQVATGAPLQIHPGRHIDSPLAAVEACVGWGADPSKIVMSHVERTLTSLDQMLALAQTGCVLEFDLFGQESSYYFDPRFTDMPNDAGRVRYLLDLISAGHLDQLAISQDICQRTHTSAFGGEGLDHILKRAVPLMGRLGIADGQIETLMVGNPARILRWVQDPS